MASISIKGVYSYSEGRKALLALKRHLVADGWLNSVDEDVLWCAALHNYTPLRGSMPADRQTDIWIVLDSENDRIQALIAAQQATATVP